MAIYRLEAKIIGRKYPVKERGKNRGKEVKKTRSVVAASAYRSGSKLMDERAGHTRNYRSRAKYVAATTILCPPGAPDWAYDRGQLWNRVEASEKRKDAQLAREFVLAVPKELNAEQQFELAVGWANQELVSRGMIAELSLHLPKEGDNYHVHVLCTMRQLAGDTFSAKKSRDWNEKALLRHWRKTWCEAENAALQKAGRPERVDHRSFKDQGIDRLPQPKIGKEAMGMVKRGVVKDPERFKAVRFVKSLNFVRPWLRQIQRNGEVKQRGLGTKWWQRALIFMSGSRKPERRTVQQTVGDIFDKLKHTRLRGRGVPGREIPPATKDRGLER